MQKDEALKILEHKNGGYTWKDIENAIAVTVEALISKQPIQIDREVWEPCEYCCDTQNRKSYKIERYPGACDFETLLDGPDEITINAYNHDTPVTEEICFSFPVSYCPKCGRPLTPEAWAELEKRLRGVKI